MPLMRAADAAVLILEKEGATQAFGLPGAAINPFYSAMKEHGGISHVLARHVEGASHMADGYSRAKKGNIGICIGTSGPAGTDMITGLYAAIADSIPILCITGQAPVAKLDKEDFQAVDIATIAAPVTKMAKTVLAAGQVPGVFQRAFQLMRGGRPGPVLIDLPIDVQMTEIEFDIDTYEPLPIDGPRATRAQAEKVLDLVAEGKKPVIIAGGGIINAGGEAELVELAEVLNVPVIPTLMGWGTIPDDHRLAAGMAGIQTSQRYGNANYLASDVVIGIGNRWANRQTGGLTSFLAGRRFAHIDIDPTQLGRIFVPEVGVASDAKSFLEVALQIAKERKAAGTLADRSEWVEACAENKRTLLRKTHFENVPIKPQRVYEEMNRAFDRETVFVTTIGLSQIAGAQFLHVYKPRHWINAGQAGPLGWTGPAALGVAAAVPDKKVVALSGDYDFQFMLEELAVGAQHHLPYVHVVVNNAYLGLIRQSQRAFEMDFEVSLAFDNVNAVSEGQGSAPGYGVDHVGAAIALGCKALRVTDPEDLETSLSKASTMADEYKVPVVVEVILERVTNISMGVEVGGVNEFEELSLSSADAPTAVTALLD